MFLGAKIAFAQSFANFQAKSPGAATIVSKIINAVVVPLVAGLFILTGFLFIWGMVKFIMHAGDSTAQKDGQRHMLWGIVGMAIMISVFGIIRIISSTVGVENPFQ